MARDIFVSKPNHLNARQASFWQSLQRILLARDLRPRTLGETDYPNRTPLEAVRLVMDECEGAVVLGYRQVHIERGREKTGSSKEKILKDTYLSTPWNQIECGMAYMLNLPLLIVREPGVEDGVFGIGNTDRFIHQAVLSRAWLDSPRFLQPLNEWIEEIHQRPRAPATP